MSPARTSPFDLAAPVGAWTALPREAWKRYGEASAAGFGALDGSGLLNLLESTPD